MGHESGLEHAGAVGLKKPMEAELAPPGEETGRLSDDQITAALEQNQLDEVRKLARQHTKTAIGTLAAIAKNHKFAPAPRVSAAKAILEWGYGKPAAQVGPRLAGGSEKLRVIILKLADGTTEEIHEVDVSPGAPPVHEQVGGGGKSVVAGVEILELTE